MRDFLPADVRKRNYVINIIKQVYESYGFEPLETPAVENLETLMGKYGEEGNQLIFKILKRGEKLEMSREFGELADLALRYDLTVPLARVVADRRNELPRFFKRYQIQPVWRADRPARGRYREFYQCDVDIIGSDSMVVEAELISAVSGILGKLGFEDFEIRINHRRFLTAILNAVNIAEYLHIDALVALDKIDKIGSEGVLTELEKRYVPEASAERLLNFFDNLKDRLRPKPTSFLDNLRTMIGLIDELGLSIDTDLAVGSLFKLAKLLEGSQHEKYVKIDPSLARGLSYYTGAIMELNVPYLSGSLGGGGRYDGLIGMFGKEQIPACGFSLGLERILVVMDERGMFPPEIAESTPADVMVAVWSEETAGESLKLAAELRATGLRVTVYPEADKLGKQMKYADSIKVPFTCILGESEIAKGNVTLKDMRSGEQDFVDRHTAATEISSRLK